MTFLFPLGLLGLIGIPIIIIIYILQSKYTEQTVPSTYLWKLSERFMKRKNPLSGLTGLISLILQILTVAVISFIIAHPVFTLPGAAKNYCFILDTSSSMTMSEGEQTRFDLAKEEIIKVIKDASGGSSYSLICASDESTVIFENVKDKDTAIELINDATVSHTVADHANLLGTAQSVFDEDPSTIIYLVTDKSYKTHESIEIIDVGTESLDNFSVFDVTYSLSGSKLNASAEVVSQIKDASLSVKLYIDGKASDSKTVSVKKGELTPVSFEAPCQGFESFTVTVENADGYSLDNSITTHNLQSDKSYSILIVSETGFFLEAVIDALVDSEVKTVSPDEYSEVNEKYGLYIFDSYEPDALPDGAVWLINADSSIEDTGFGVRGKIELPTADVIQKSSSTSTNVRSLLKGVDGKDIYISNYIKYSEMYLNFHTLFSYESNPLIFAGANGLGNRQVVFGFDLHESDIVLSSDFVILLRNLIDYSFPGVIDNSNYTVGDEAMINILTSADNYRALSPSGKDIYIDSSSVTDAVKLNEVGTYTVTVTIAGKEIPYKIYAGAHPDESKPATNGEDFSLSGERTDANIDGEFDPTVLLFIIAAVIFIADWGVYCYEKYQLR